MTRLVMENATVLDGDHPPVAGRHVVVDGERISAVGPGRFADRAPDDTLVDLGGRTVMPGMVNCHFHATYHNLGAVPAPFGLEEPMALQAVRAVNSLELLVNSGFTSAVSAGAPFAIDASMKVAIERGLIPGPRLVPCSRDISTTGHAGDRSYPPHWEVGALGAIRPSDGPDGFRRSVRAEIKEGAEFIKMFVTGGHGTIGPREQIEMTREEMAAGIEAAHLRGAKVRGHIANREAILMALDLDIDVIDHGDGMDDECMDRIIDSGTPVVPSMMFPARFLASMGGSALGFTDSMKSDIDAMAEVLPKANAAGMCLVLGDDYGAIFLPARLLCRGACLLRRGDRHPRPGRDPVGHQARRRTDGPGRRARNGRGGEAGRPSRGRWRSARRRHRPPGPDQPAGHHQGRPDGQGRPGGDSSHLSSRTPWF